MGLREWGASRTPRETSWLNSPSIPCLPTGPPGTGPQGGAEEPRGLPWQGHLSGQPPALGHPDPSRRCQPSCSGEGASQRFLQVSPAQAGTPATQGRDGSDRPGTLSPVGEQRRCWMCGPDGRSLGPSAPLPKLLLALSSQVPHQPVGVEGVLGGHAPAHDGVQKGLPLSGVEAQHLGGAGSRVEPRPRVCPSPTSTWGDPGQTPTPPTSHPTSRPQGWQQG